MELTPGYAPSDTWCGECLVMGAGDRRVQCGGSSLSGLQVSFPGLLPLFTNFTALSSSSLTLAHWFCTATLVKQLLLFQDPERNFYIDQILI